MILSIEMARGGPAGRGEGEPSCRRWKIRKEKEEKKENIQQKTDNASEQWIEYFAFSFLSLSAAALASRLTTMPLKK